ncbi:MAG TPA: hypothetical protein VGY53_10770, partial [Isosphaeraceae bacterium]|nr:hypothetical protein [Isosphaeraceae bacterium]
MKCLFKTLIVVAVAVGVVHAIRDARIAHRRHHDVDFTWVGFDDGSAPDQSNVPQHRINIQVPRRPPRPPRAPRP